MEAPYRCTSCGNISHLEIIDGIKPRRSYKGYCTKCDKHVRKIFQNDFDLSGNTQLAKDLKKYKAVAYCGTTKCFLPVLKYDLRRWMAHKKIHYFISEDIYTVKRNTIVII